MIILYAGLILFFAVHFFSTFRSRSLEQDIKRRLGEKKYMGVYSIASALGLGLIVWGYKQTAIGEQLVAPIADGRTISSVLMLFAFVLVVAAQMPAGHIKKLLRHPMLIGVCLWSISHLINGASYKHFLLFGSFLIFSVIDMLVASRRESATVTVTPPSVKYDVVAIVIGCIAYTVVALHVHDGISDLLVFW